MARVSQRSGTGPGQMQKPTCPGPFLLCRWERTAEQSKAGTPASLALSVGTAGRPAGPGSAGRFSHSQPLQTSERARAAWLCLGPEGPLGACWPSPKDCSCVNSGWGLGGGTFPAGDTASLTSTLHGLARGGPRDTGKVCLSQEGTSLVRVSLGPFLRPQDEVACICISFYYVWSLQFPS